MCEYNRSPPPSSQLAYPSLRSISTFLSPSYSLSQDTPNQIHIPLFQVVLRLHHIHVSPSSSCPLSSGYLRLDPPFTLTVHLFPFPLLHGWEEKEE